ncbi:MAG: primosomal protein N' [Planctomycetes bacterium]|nr:primosomal protein N' [Planctomycetota bacterium]
MSKSKQANSTAPLWIEEGETKVGPVATVAPLIPVDKRYSFAVPPRLSGQLQPGQRVLVPLGRANRATVAFCIVVEQRPWKSTLKEITELVDEVSYLPADLLELGEWISRYYACPLGKTLSALVPESVRQQAGFRTIRFAALAPECQSGGTVWYARPWETQQSDAPRPRVGRKQQAILDALGRASERVEVKSLLDQTGASGSTLRSLATRGWITLSSERRAADAPSFDLPSEEPSYSLNPEQDAAVERMRDCVDRGEFAVTLLHGVGGSGKTEVYIRVMQHVLAQGRQAIMLVPEIMLTTQLVKRLASRFRDIALVHSGLTGAQRSLLWREIAAGNRPVVIGTRSAVFAPCPNLGIIVVDEEQDGSYKNLQAPRFHVRDVAVKRGQLLGIPVLLGSATPALETWHNCDRLEHFTKIELTKRVRDLPMPQVEIVDMQREIEQAGRNVLLSQALTRKLSGALERGEQALVLVNRRGYAMWLYCPSCQLVQRCPNCTANMIYHRSRRELLCHYCSRRIPAPTHCPTASCNAELVPRGSGTQRVEDRIRSLWPDANIVRADSDTMSHRREYQKIIADLEARRIDVLVGTQMIAKGLDFPFVSFVGVIAADVGAGSADFRVAERLFQLVTQVASRAGRAETRGEVVVQSMDPDSPALRAALHHDYAGFAAEELSFRKACNYPPYCRLVRFLVADRRQDRARSECEALATRCRERLSSLGRDPADVMGPTACVLERLRGRYRFHVLLRAESGDALAKLLADLRAHDALTCRAQSMMIDVDPISMT